MGLLYSLQRKYGGFFSDDGYLVVQCPFHDKRYPSVLIWMEDGILRFKCKEGCDEEKLKMYFCGDGQKLQYNTDWKESSQCDLSIFDISEEESREKRIRFLSDQITVLLDLKKRIQKEGIRFFERQSWFGKTSDYTPEGRRLIIELSIEAINSEIEKLRSVIKSTRRTKEENTEKSKLTQKDIDYALSIPFDQIFEFKKGRALCPFHDDHNPSLYWWKEKNLAHCFGCNRTWNTITFIMELKGISFKDAVQYLINI